jgi:cation diffusion facilitator CzcD-associated flavoprotein CzcO
VKNLLAVGRDDVVCYDESGAIGGNWAFDDRRGRTSVYETTHLISSKKWSEFEDYPVPADYPDFPSHRQMLAYFNGYADHFQLRPYIRLGTQVERAELAADGRWSVRVRYGGEARQETFDHLVVCSGHHREPLIPETVGRFTGEVLHSSEFKRAEPFRGKRVLVVGGGNSGCDIAVDVSRVAQRACLSMRRGYYIMPKILFGRPVDVTFARVRRHMPRALLQPLIALGLRLMVGRPEKYGLQPPQCGPLEMHPTLNTNVLSALRDGDVLPRVGIDRIDGRTVHFRDGAAEEFDTIIWATGFRIAFPFLDSSVVDWDTTAAPPLYLKMMHRRIANLFFIGLFQPIGCIWRLADRQARIAALQIAGRLERPAAVMALADRERQSSHWRFSKVPRHAIEVDYHRFGSELARELARASA